MQTGSDAATAETMLVSLAADSQLKTVTSFFPLKAKREVFFKDSHKWLQVFLQLKNKQKIKSKVIKLFNLMQLQD